jgi:hypothetical protein
MTTQFAFLMVICFTLLIWMWFYMSKRGGLGKEETQAAATHERVADK